MNVHERISELFAFDKRIDRSIVVIQRCITYHFTTHMHRMIETELTQPTQCKIAILRAINAHMIANHLSINHPINQVIQFNRL
jgi:hypothetical protein